MMQMQKFQLETAAAQRVQHHTPEKQAAAAAAAALGGSPSDVASCSGSGSAEAGDQVIQYSVIQEPQEEMMCMPMGEVNQSFLMSHYVQGVPMETDGSEQQIIVFEEPVQEMDVMSIFDPQQSQDQMQENARVLVVKNNPTQPLYSDTYM